MRVLIFVVALATVSFSSCKKIKFSDFTVKGIETLRLPDAPDNSLMQFKLEGPGMNEITSWRYYSGSFFIPTEFGGDKPKKDYDLTLIRQTGGTETEVSTMTIDFGDYLDQDAFFVENDQMRIKLHVEWKARW